MRLYRFLVLAAVACSTVLAVPEKADKDMDAIAKIRTEWANDLHSKQLDRIMELYALDAVFLQPNGQRITGRSAIRRLTEIVMAKFTSDIALRSLASEHSGKLAYDSGEFSETLITSADSSSTHTRGNYLMVFRHEKNRWLIIEQVWTESSPSHN